MKVDEASGQVTKLANGLPLTAVAVGIATSGIAWVEDTDGAKFAGPNAGFVQVDVRTGKTIGRVRVADPGKFVMTDDALWVTSDSTRSDSDSIAPTKIDTGTGRILVQHDLPVGPITGLAATADDLWLLAAGTRAQGRPLLIRIDRRTSETRATLNLPAPSYLAVASQAASVWVAEDAGAVQQVDAAYGRLGVRFEAPRTFSLAASEGHLWLLAPGPKGSMTAAAVKIDTTTGRVGDTIALPVGQQQVPDRVLADGDAIWVPDGPDILRIQPS